MKTAKQHASRRYYLKRKAAGKIDYRDPEKRARMLESSKRRYAEIRDEFFQEYGGMCVCCKEMRGEFLTMDHGAGDVGPSKEIGTLKSGKPLRVPSRGTGEYYRLKKLGWPKNTGIRILCMNCNWATRGGKTCPHPDGVTGTSNGKLGPLMARNDWRPDPPINGGKKFMDSLTYEQRAAWTSHARSFWRPRIPKEFCRKGHPLSGNNLVMKQQSNRPRPYRDCRTCHGWTGLALG